MIEAKRFANHFCAVCGGRLPLQPKDTDAVIIPAGSLDEEAPIRPQARIFAASRASWSCSGDAMTVYQESPPQ
ncbi:MAG: GFA family protein [Burkholderiaceae bacterium]|nr:GFA family protein [Burkholderiaceae bacterium]